MLANKNKKWDSGDRHLLRRGLGFESSLLYSKVLCCF